MRNEFFLPLLPNCITLLTEYSTRDCITSMLLLRRQLLSSSIIERKRIRKSQNCAKSMRIIFYSFFFALLHYYTIPLLVCRMNTVIENIRLILGALAVLS